MDWLALAMEGGVFCVFIIGVLVSRLLGRRWHPAEVVFIYVLGLLFEVLTSYMWEYHHILVKLPLAVAGDISALFPLGWAGLVMMATALAERVWGRYRIGAWWARHLVLVVAWLVVGDTSETLFYNAGLFSYVRDERTAFIFAWGQAEPFPPTFILLGYGILLPFVSHYLRWLERGLGAPTGRNRWK